MKKSLLALAVLGAFAGAASAQSSITIFGVVDANLGKDVGSDDKRMGQGAQSRLGFRGVEDIGNGLRATFHFQHRFDSGTGIGQGTPGTSQNPFWQAEANVGLAGGFGNIRLGRQYTESFYHQISIDPFGYDTVANLKTFTEGGIAGTRSNNAISYWITTSGFTVGVQTAERNDNGGAAGNVAQPGVNGEKRPVNLRLQYAAGPIAAGVSYENPPDGDDNWTLVTGSYNFGAVKAGGFYGSGKTAAALSRKSFGVVATMPLGTGEGRVALARLRGPNSATGADITQRQQLSLGYHYSLSKRTVIYGDVATAKTDNAALNTTASGNGKDSDSGYDFGIKHSF